MLRNLASATVLICIALSAENGLAQSANPTAISVYPESVNLDGPRSRQQIIVSGRFGQEDLRDVTHLATVAAADPSLVQIDGPVVQPLKDGQTTLSVTVGQQTAQVPVIVQNGSTADPVGFRNEVLAALTKAGCNSGACHGSPSGKGGFRLSLRGYDPPLDIATLRGEFYRRRVNVMQPDESLLLKKPLMQVSHGGGRKLMVGDPVHQTLQRWISEGLQVEDAGKPELLRIEVFPRQRVFQDEGDRQQLTVTGFFSDGSQRDLTPLTVFSSSSDSVATVSTDGLVTKAGRGETAILARYLDKMDTSELTFLETVEGFVWHGEPEHNFIDRLVNAKLRQLQIAPSELCSDDEFLRRAYLDLVGRLPTIPETEAFLNDASREKRSALVDRLLETTDHARFWAMKWADVLQVNSNNLKPAGVAKFNQWLYQSVADDEPFDEFARDLLTASGSVYVNPAANYWRSSRTPTDATETTAQLFLGIRIQCAKCHNHPFERWSQDDYYGMAAAFARVARKPGQVADDEAIFVQDSGEITQPRTGSVMKVHLLLEGAVEVPEDQDRREVFAEWLTRPDNPFFAKATVNRIWGHLFGRGIVDPVDDFRDSNPPSNAELLDALAAHFATYDYSRKEIIRQIMNSRTYQRSAVTNEFNEGDELYFSHAVPRLLGAEQLLDAICQVTGVPESFAGVPAGTRAVELPEPPHDHEFLKTFGQPQREMTCECERGTDSNLSQALQMINGSTVHEKLRSDSGRIARLISEELPDEKIIERLYMAALSRIPTTEELQVAAAHIKASPDRRLAIEDVAWAVVNSKEFLFQH